AGRRSLWEDGRSCRAVRHAARCSSRSPGPAALRPLDSSASASGRTPTAARVIARGRPSAGSMRPATWRPTLLARCSKRFARASPSERWPPASFEELLLRLRDRAELGAHVEVRRFARRVVDDRLLGGGGARLVAGLLERGDETPFAVRLLRDALVEVRGRSLRVTRCARAEPLHVLEVRLPLRAAGLLVHLGFE